MYMYLYVCMFENNRLRALKHEPDIAFGNVHVVLVGDFGQLPPVAGDPIYSKRKKLRSVKSRPGVDLFLNGFNSAITFDVNKRAVLSIFLHKKDAYKQSCRRVIYVAVTVPFAVRKVIQDSQERYQI